MTLPLVLIPGIASDATIWSGMPEGEVMTSTAATIDAMADDILARAPPRFALAGSSLGGYVALAIVRAAPERVARLALLSTSPRPDDDKQKAVRGSMIEAATRDYDRLVDAMIATMIHPDAAADPALVASLGAMARRTGAASFVRQQQAAMARPDASAGLAAIAVPTLILTGADDRVVPPERSVEMARAIRDATLVVVPRCGHIPQLERPQETMAALRKWLA